MTRTRDIDFVDVRHGVQKSATRTRLILENIKCDGCGKTISDAVTSLGINNSFVSPEGSYVEFDNPIDEKQIETALVKLKELGYPLVDTEEGLKAVALKARSYLSCALGKLS